jgi:uncharacterized protein (DUF924 family)
MSASEQSALQPVLKDIHDYWFGALKAPDDRSPADKSAIWFRRSDETDAHIRETWGPFIARAAAVDWDLGALSREERVGLVILLDQFPRNIYRTTGEAFAYDPKARGIAGRLIADGVDRLWLQEQNFVFLPFVHSEDVADQDHALLLGARAAIDAPEAWKEDRRINLDFATRHRDIIRKFGRFPHRNEMLGRDSTPEELEFLKGGRGY